MDGGAGAKTRTRGKGAIEFLALVAVLVVAVALVAGMWWRSAREYDPAELMPPGAAAYVSVSGVDRLWTTIRGSKWFASMADLVRSDPAASRAWDRVRAELRKIVGNMTDVGPFLRARSAAALYPKPGRLDYLIVTYTHEPRAYGHQTAQMYRDHPMIKTLKIEKYRGCEIKVVVDSMKERSYGAWLPDRGLDIDSNRRDLVTQAIDRLLGHKSPSLADDPAFRALVRYQADRPLGLMVRPDHPAVLRLLPVGGKFTTKDWASIRWVLLASDYVSFEAVVELKSGPNKWRAILKQVLASPSRGNFLELIPRTPNTLIVARGLNPVGAVEVDPHRPPGLGRTGPGSERVGQSPHHRPARSVVRRDSHRPIRCFPVVTRQRAEDRRPDRYAPG